MRAPARRKGPRQPLPAVLQTSPETIRELGEVHARLEAMACISASALLGEVDKDAALECNVVLAERADLHLRVVMEPVP